MRPGIRLPDGSKLAINCKNDNDVMRALLTRKNAKTIQKYKIFSYILIY